MNVTRKPIPGEKLPSPLKTLRFQHGLTQAAVIKLIDVDAPRISRLENDLLRDTPATARLKAGVAALFGVPCTELFPKGEQKG